MKIINDANYPEPIMRALERFAAPHERGGADISVTELIGPPQIQALKERYWDQLEQPASALFWALLGTSTHHIIEQAAGEDDLQETRLSMTVDDWTVSGQVDNLSVKSGIITDYKVTSVWTMVYRDRMVEWEKQLNIYAELVRHAGNEVNGLQVLAILRDWSQAKALQGGDYPSHQAVIVPLKLWPADECLMYIGDRVAEHKRFRTTGEPNCSDEDRWYRGDSYAVMKKGRKSALRVLNSRKQAEDWQANWHENNEGETNIELREGEHTRCAKYCPVAAVCPQWRALQSKKEVVAA